jgi:hypothetical protein
MPVSFLGMYIYTTKKNHVHLFLALPQCSCSVFAEKLEGKQVEEE